MKKYASYNISYCSVDLEGFRYLLTDYQGNLFILVLFTDGVTTTLKMDLLGQTSIATSIAYLTDGYTFIGSHFGDSQLISLLVDPTPEKTYLKIVKSYSNLAPITDFAVVDFEKQGQGQMVACCGAYAHGSLKIIRNGIGIEEMASLGDMSELHDLWSLKATFNSEWDSIILLGFIGQTRALRMDIDGLGEVEDLGGLKGNERTLACGTVVGDFIVQVTASGVWMVRCETLEAVSSWTCDSPITCASINATQIVISLAGGILNHLAISNGNLELVATKEMSFEISCIDATTFDDALRAKYCSVGLWNDHSIRILALPSLNEISQDVIAGGIFMPDIDTIPRSILSVHLDNKHYLMAALGIHDFMKAMASYLHIRCKKIYN